jgi:AraC-like DNA-binding protein
LKRRDASSTPTTEGLLLGRLLLPIAEVARRHGLDALLAASGIAAEQVTGLDAMVPSARIYQWLEAIATRVDVEHFAIAAATATNASDMGLLGLAMRAAPSARHALELMLRYQRLVNTMADFHVIDGEGELTLAEDRCGPDGPGRLFAAEITAMTNIHWSRLLLGPGSSPTRVALPRRATFARYAAWASCPVIGGAARASVSFRAAALDQPVATSDDELWRFLSDLLAANARPANRSPLVHQLRRELASVLAEGAPALSAVARRLGQAPRSLQRRLAQEGTTYLDVLDQLRRELAAAHLGKQKLSIPEIAFTLGFDEVASFHRAFRRWEGTTPAAFRASLSTKTNEPA